MPMSVAALLVTTVMGMLRGRGKKKKTNGGSEREVRLAGTTTTKANDGDFRLLSLER